MRFDLHYFALVLHENALVLHENALVLHENTLVFSQSEARDFFMYIITTKIQVDPVLILKSKKFFDDTNIYWHQYKKIHFIAFFNTNYKKLY